MEDDVKQGPTLTITIGEIAYEAYREHAGGVSLAHGGTLPRWSGLEQKFVDAWEAAATAVRTYTENRLFIDRTAGQLGRPPILSQLIKEKLAASESSAQKPSIGRIVIWHGETRRPAIITEVLESGALVLSICTGVLGEPVRVAYGCREGDSRGQWSWPERV